MNILDHNIKQSKFIKQILTGLYTIGGNYYDLVVDIPISSVDTNKSIVMVTVSSDRVWDYYPAQNLYVRGHLENSTTLRLYSRVNNSSRPVFVRWTVIEFTKVKSLQKGFASNVTQINISQVNTNKSLIFINHTINDGQDKITTYHLLSPSFINNGTAIKISDYPYIYTNVFYHWQVVEFY